MRKSVAVKQHFSTIIIHYKSIIGSLPPMMLLRSVTATIACVGRAAAVIVAAAAATTAVAECREHEEYDDPYPDVSVVKNIAKAVHGISSSSQI